jgi:hypothetical protein
LVQKRRQTGYDAWLEGKTEIGRVSVMVGEKPWIYAESIAKYCNIRRVKSLQQVYISTRPVGLEMKREFLWAVDASEVAAPRSAIFRKVK